MGQNHLRAPTRDSASAAEGTVSNIEQAGRPERLSVEHRVLDGVRVVTLRGEIDHQVKGVFQEALLSENHATAPVRIVVDLSDVTFMDSSGINVLIAARRAVSGTQGWLRIAGAQGPVLHVLHIVGVDALIGCHPHVEQALNL
ncbi:hypothetical protein GCM10012282_25570 [Streptomyces lacrimifluminis]|uniref:Anti-sigma factor antagonist n=1 Tax=Streptomyces lacrimifluminis TaxID=1500077 RepID=A0A917KSW5_9ACTN|nr:hypothetical protein GCM10012282_25570 [Streptomyces lacrimifluminis]